jgi:hypothetical protein
VGVLGKMKMKTALRAAALWPSARNAQFVAFSSLVSSPFLVLRLDQESDRAHRDLVGGVGEEDPQAQQYGTLA